MVAAHDGEMVVETERPLVAQRVHAADVALELEAWAVVGKHHDRAFGDFQESAPVVFCALHPKLRGEMLRATAKRLLYHGELVRHGGGNQPRATTVLGLRHVGRLPGTLVVHPERQVLPATEAELPDDVRHLRPFADVSAPRLAPQVGVRRIRRAPDFREVRVELQRARAYWLLVVHCDVEPARRRDIDQPLLVGVEDVDVARAYHRVESGAHRRLVDFVRQRRAEADVVARIVDLPRAVLLGPETVQEVLVVYEPPPELERRVALADRDAFFPFAHHSFVRFDAAPIVKRIDAEAVGREAVEAEHHAAIIRARDFQDVSGHGLDQIVLPPLTHWDNGRLAR